MNNFNENYQKSLQVAWDKFINNEDYDYSSLRSEVLESWHRSRNAKVSPYETIGDILTDEALNIRINANISLIEIVHPYMKNLYSVVQGSGFYILFCDKDGFILDLIGDPDIIEHGKNYSQLVAGANRRESVVGTNAIGTCLVLGKPIQIWGEEHYISRHKDYVCSGAPFFDSNGNIMGCLAITGKAESVHPHTLGMIISAVDGITKELNIRKAYEDIELISAQRNSIIQSMTAGLLLLNTAGRVIQVNNVALRLLNLKYENIIGKNLFEFISFEEKLHPEANLSFINKELYNKEVNIYLTGTPSPPLRFNMSITFVKDHNGNCNGTVIRLNEPELINRLVNNINGYKSKYTFDSIIGNSDATRKLIATCMRAANSSSNILILGQSGTGKELLAQSMHNASSFHSGPFVAINCAAMPRGLVESELFGYEKGAFTGANKDGNPGKFELADGGTIFLDEIGDMPLDVQASLLRVIQTKEIVRVGGKYPKAINVRIIAATNRDLQQAIEQKTFREDLYYRLNVLTIEVPPLSKRGSDVCQLADFFVKIYGLSRNISISPDVYPLLQAYRWPGNIRQLENVIERAVNITDTNIITVQHLPLELQSHLYLDRQVMCESRRPSNPSNDLPSEVHHFNMNSNGEDLIRASLKECHGNVTEAAKLLGISRRTLYRKLDKFEMSNGEFRHK